MRHIATAVVALALVVAFATVADAGVMNTADATSNAPTSATSSWPTKPIAGPTL